MLLVSVVILCVIVLRKNVSIGLLFVIGKGLILWVICVVCLVSFRIGFLFVGLVVVFSVIVFCFSGLKFLIMGLVWLID